MIKGDLVSRVGELQAARVPFVHATVVRAAAPTSVRPGDSALVLADGTIDGFVGGTCAQASVRLHAIRAMETGDSLLLRLVPGGPSLPEQPVGATMIYRPAQQPTAAASAEELGVEREVVTLNVNGSRHEVTKQRTTLGRSRDCDVQIEDPSASRRHAEVRQEGTSYWIVDLDSTNGIEVNGMRTKRAKLQHGDRITIGSTDVSFRRDIA